MCIGNNVVHIQLTLDQHRFRLCLAVSSCQLHQLPCCVSLFAEPRVDKEWVGSWKETQGAAGAADVFILSWLAQQPQAHRIILWWTQRTQPSRSRKGLPGGAYICFQTQSGPWPNCMRIALSALSCYITVFTKRGVREPDQCHLDSFAPPLQTP